MYSFMVEFFICYLAVSILVFVWLATKGVLYLNSAAQVIGSFSACLLWPVGLLIAVKDSFR